MPRTVFLVLLLCGAAVLGTAGDASADTCTCDIHVYSDYRWMDPWWGLECNNHCGHGYVGSSCDTAHGTGCGAMSGSVKIRYSSGSTIRNLNCPDDHRTCFRGPSACDDGGSWGNTCSADVWHCIPGGLWDGTWNCNGLSDAGLIYQTSAWGAVFSGACGTNWFNVLESIVEHDPWCCDDPMGNINVSTWTTEGYATTYLSGGAQNCNGGSQGGVYPHCGSFGATLLVDTSCYTTYSYSGGGGGEEPPPQEEQATELQRGIEEQRQALAGSLSRRERRMAETPRTVVEAEVGERAGVLGIKASVQALTNLLFEAGTAELARDRCRLEHPEGGAACGDLEQRLAQLETAFRKLSGGVAMRDFRSGSGPLPPPEAPAPRR